MLRSGIEEPVIDVSELRRDYGGVCALAGVSLRVRAGEIHALLGPNGAGKTTLLRVLTGLVAPTAGAASVGGIDPADRLELQRAVGFVPASDRSFYLRISARENLLFFGRLYGYPRKIAALRGAKALEQVGLSHAADQRLYTFSHGMLKRLAIARGLLTSPIALLVDEATHDLDPDASRNVRALVTELAERGTAVLWTTQRIEEIRAFADTATVLTKGTVRFQGSVPSLLARAESQSFVLTVTNGGLRGAELASAMQAVLGMRATVNSTISAGEGDTLAGDLPTDSFRVGVATDVALGDVIGALWTAGITVVGCRDERPEAEEAFLRLTAETSA